MILHEKARGDDDDGIDILPDGKGPKNTNMTDCFSILPFVLSYAGTDANLCEPLFTGIDTRTILPLL